MTENEAISILSEVIPKGSDDFERLYKLYGDMSGSKAYAIDVFNRKWKNIDILALETITKLYLKERKPDDFKFKLSSFLEYELEEYIQIKQRKLEEQEKVNIQIGANK